MSIQIYYQKKNFDVQKAERFFKERRVPFQLIDLNKHKLGKKELDLFLRVSGSCEKLINRQDKATNKHPIALVFTENLMYDAILNNPSCLISPIVRFGNKITLGANETEWLTWLSN